MGDMQAMVNVHVHACMSPYMKECDVCVCVLAHNGPRPGYGKRHGQDGMDIHHKGINVRVTLRQTHSRLEVLLRGLS